MYQFFFSHHKKVRTRKHRHNNKEITISNALFIMIDPDDFETETTAAAVSKHNQESKEKVLYFTADQYGDVDEPETKRRKTFHKSEAQLKEEEERRRFARAQEEMFRDERAQSKIDHINHLQKIAAEKNSFLGGHDNSPHSTLSDDDDDDDAKMTDGKRGLRLGEKDTWTGKDEDKHIRGGVEKATLDREGHIAKLEYEEEEEDFGGDGYKYDGDIRIEPFNLKKERENGYFDDSGFYIENSKTKDSDPWLDEEYDKVYAKELERPENKAKILRNLMLERQRREFEFGGSDSDSESDEDGTGLSKECRFLQTIVNLLAKDTETVSDGLRRLGNKKSGEANPEQFNELTDAADGLLGLGNMGIYAETKASLSKTLSTLTKDSPYAVNTAVPTAGTQQQQEKLWEYKFENGDGTIQGPFTSQQMAFWQAQGFFSGAYVALVRPAKGKEKSLLDDLEEDENGGNDFVRSDTIDFSKM